MSAETGSATEISSSSGSQIKEIVFGQGGGKDIEPIGTEPEITIGGTYYRWITQLSINGEKYGASEGFAKTNNLVVQKGEYINSVRLSCLFGGYGFLTHIEFGTNHNNNEKWIMAGRETAFPGTYEWGKKDDKFSGTKEPNDKVELTGIRVLSIGGSHGGLGDSLTQLKIRYIDNYKVAPQPEPLDEDLWAVIDIIPEGTEVYESKIKRVKELEAISSISEFTASSELQVTQTYLLAEATAKIGLSYMNRQEILDQIEKESTDQSYEKKTIPSGKVGVRFCAVEVRKISGIGPDGKDLFMLLPKTDVSIGYKTMDGLRKMQFFDLSGNLRFSYPELAEFGENWGIKNYHKAEN